MASSKVSPLNQDLKQPFDQNISVNMDDLIKNIYDQSPEMTLEDYLMKSGAVTEEEVVKLPEYSGAVVPFSGVLPRQQVYGGGGGGGRGKRKVVVEDVVVDKVTQQKQRRMIKNRESAARSRERKQAYTVELESLVTQLEEEHAKLLKEVDELNKQRLKQLMDNLMPVVEKKRPPRVLRRTNSM